MSAVRLSRRAFLGASSLALIPIVAACAGAASAPTVAPVTASTQVPAPTAAAAPSGANTTINVLTWAPANDVGRNADQKFLESYLASKSLNVTVKTQDVPFGTYMQKLQTMFAGNVAPDVLWASIWRTGPFIEANKLLQLDDYMKSDANLPKYKPVAFNDGKFGGKQYGLPTAASTWVLY